MGPVTRPRRPGLGTEGSVLILALWILAFLGIVGTSLAYRMSVGLKLAGYSWREIQLRELAQDAVRVTAALWLHSDRDLPEAYLNQAAPEGTWSVESLVDESGKINLNQAPREVLERLFASSGASVQDILERRQRAPFRSLEELLLVRGMRPETLASVEDYLTVYTEGPVNVNTASEPVLLALGLPSSLAAKLLAFRREGGRFDQAGSVASQMKEKFPMQPQELEPLTRLLGQEAITAQPGGLQLRVVARLNDRRTSRAYAIVMSGRRTPGQILYWRELDR